MRMLTCASLVVCLGAGLDAAPVPAARFAATPVPEATAVRIDGELNDAVWLKAPPITEFKQREPRDGAEPSFATDARVAYDDTSLYIAVQAFDPDPSRIQAIRTRRDEDSPSDWIRVVIDSFHDRRSGFEFAVNPAGVKQDRYWFNDTSNDPGWDAVWDVAIARGERGWRAEFRIPLSQLRFHRSDEATFGFAVVRQVGRLNETSTWPLLSKSANGYVSSFGELTGLRLERRPKRLEMVPYAVSDVSTQSAEAGNPLSKSVEGSASIGLDLKYALKPGLTLTATVNPDFGQVEADPAVVNLSAFETFFSERRPFFVEGSGIFRFDVDCNDGSCSGLFYSRRIGRAPRGTAGVPEGGFSSAPAQTTILGAAKLTGRVGAFSIGALNAVTASEHATIADGPLRSRQLVEPAAGYSVVRARREFSNQSALGFIVTATNRNVNAATEFLPSQAYTGGMDWDWRLSPTYAVTGFWATSSVRGDVPAIDALQRSNVHSFQRPDAEALEYDPQRTALNGYAAQFGVSKIGGERVRFSSYLAAKSPGFDINDVGFMRRADQRTMSNWLQWRHERPSKYLRSFRFNLNQWAGWNFDGDRLSSGGNINAHAVFPNLWSAGFGINVNARGFDDRATRGGPGAYDNPQRSLWTYLNTDNRRRVSAGVNTFHLTDRYGTTLSEVGPFVTWRPATFLSVRGGFSVSNNNEQSQWVGTEGERYVFARLEQKTVGITARVNYTVSPTLSIQMYAEPFVSAGDYSQFKALVNGRSTSYAERYSPIAYGRDPDFNYRSFRTTNVLRWEYRPGSTLFVVWQQGREDVLGHGSFSFGRDVGGVFDAPGRNVFLVKLAYWVNP